MRAVVVLVALAFAARAEAQVSGIVVSTCDATQTAPVLDALRLELGDGLDVFDATGTSLRITAPCDGDATVVLEDARSGVILSRVVPLADLPQALHARMLSLVAGELARLARRAQASRLSQSEPEMLEAVATAEPEENAPALDIPVRPPREETPSCVDSVGRPCVALPLRSTRFVSDAAMRVFPLAPIVLGGVRLGVERARWTTGAALLAGRHPVSAGTVGVLLPSLDVGVRVFPKRDGSTFALVLHGELGLARTRGRSSSTAMRGVAGLAPTFAGSMQALFRLTAREAPIGFRLAIELGYTSGPRARDADDKVLLTLAGPFVGLALGVSL